MAINGHFTIPLVIIVVSFLFNNVYGKCLDCACLPLDYNPWKADQENSVQPNTITIGLHLLRMIIMDKSQGLVYLMIQHNFSWVDNRIEYNCPLPLRKPGPISDIWRPEATIRGLKSYEPIDVMGRKAYYQINKDRTNGNVVVSYTVIAQVILRCKSDLSKDPLIYLYCRYEIMSNLLDMNDLIFKWNPDFHLTKYLETPDMYYTVSHFENETVRYLSPTNFTVTGFQLDLQTQIRGYLMLYFMPSAILMVVNLTSFLIPVKALSTRFVLNITPLLAQINFVSTSDRFGGNSAFNIFVVSSVIFNIVCAIGQLVTIWFHHDKRRFIIVNTAIFYSLVGILSFYQACFWTWLFAF